MTNHKRKRDWLKVPLKKFAATRLGKALVALLKAGLSPEKLAASIAWGLTLACFPIVGATSALCVLVATLARLNHVSIQTVNHLGAPLQLLLMLPFCRLGERLLGVTPTPFRISEVMVAFESNFGAALKTYAAAGAYAIVGWLVIAPVIWSLCYTIALRVLRSTKLGQQRNLQNE